MSILTYAVIAKTSDAREIAEDFLSKKFVWQDLPGFDPSVLDTVHSLLSGTPVSKSSRTVDILPMLYQQDPDEGCWVFEIPDDWVKLMATIDVQKVPGLTKNLIKKNRMLKEWNSIGGLDIPSFEEHLIRLRDLSQRASTKKASLLLCLSL